MLTLIEATFFDDYTVYQTRYSMSLFIAAGGETEYYLTIRTALVQKIMFASYFFNGQFIEIVIYGYGTCQCNALSFSKTCGPLVKSVRIINNSVCNNSIITSDY